MKPGDTLTTLQPIRSQKTGIVLPRQGTFISSIENLGRQLILVNFGSAGQEYLFPNEIIAASAQSEIVIAEGLTSSEGWNSKEAL